MNPAPDPLGPAFPAWLQTREDIARWVRVAGVRCGWDDRQELPPGSEVYYQDRTGNRLVCRVERSAFVPVVSTERGVAGTTATVLVPVRWEPGGVQL
jgi:hypothetical protein